MSGADRGSSSRRGLVPERASIVDLGERGVDPLLFGPGEREAGQLVAQRAIERGQRPLLAGRDAEKVAKVATPLGLPHRVFDLRDGAGVAEALGDVDAVAHCAGPFSATSAPMVDGCLRTGTHYLDVTGEVDVFESVFARHDEARRAGVVLLPGSGFDVVPTDCLAALVAAAVEVA